MELLSSLLIVIIILVELLIKRFTAKAWIAHLTDRLDFKRLLRIKTLSIGGIHWVWIHLLRLHVNLLRRYYLRQILHRLLPRDFRFTKVNLLRIAIGLLNIPLSLLLQHQLAHDSLKQNRLLLLNIEASLF